MKYLGEEKEVQVQTVNKRYVEYMRCDRCRKKIMPCKFTEKESQYVHIHTWHNDWGNDSIDSHEYHDYCVECAKEVVSEYIGTIYGSEELELSNEYLTTNESYNNYEEKYSYCHSGYKLVKNDNK